VARALGESGLAKPAERGGWARLIVDKPFGRDLETARRLDDEIHAVFDESQVYRIDHYLGKETVQNLFVLRFINGIFEPIWNRNYIDQVQITAAETVGVEGRGGYYEQAGAVRDMFQSHMLQLLTLTAMEPPSSFTAEKVHDAYQRLLLDAMRGDSTLFARTDEVEGAWSLVTPLLDHIANDRQEPLPVYSAGNWGPAEADGLLERDGYRWRQL